MITTFHATTRTCRKPHVCDGCGLKIPAGWMATSWSFVTDGDGWFTSYWHPACHLRATDTGEIYEDGSTPFLEDDEEHMALIGAFAAWSDIRQLADGARAEPETAEGLLFCLRQAAPSAEWTPGGGMEVFRFGVSWTCIAKPDGVWSTLRQGGQWQAHATFALAMKSIVKMAEDRS